MSNIGLKELIEIIDKRVSIWNFVALLGESEVYIHKQDDDIKNTIQMVDLFLGDYVMDFWGKDKENFIEEISDDFPKTMEKDYDLMTTQQLMSDLSNMFPHIVLTYINNEKKLVSLSSGNAIICIGLCTVFLEKLEYELEENEEEYE